MTDPVDTFEHAGLTVEIHYDDSPESPREWSNVGHMVCWHRRTNLGDETIRTEDYANMDALLDSFRDQGARVILPLWLYEHGGMSMRVGDGNAFSDEWDSGLVGFIYDTPEGVKECIGDDATEEQIKACLVQEVETYDEFLQGMVYGYEVKDVEGEVLDACWGYYGSDHVRQSAREAAEGEAANIERERVEAKYWALRDVPTEV
jgi:hypothetical protein